MSTFIVKTFIWSLLFWNFYFFDVPPENTIDLLQMKNALVLKLLDLLEGKLNLYFCYSDLTENLYPHLEMVYGINRNINRLSTSSNDSYNFINLALRSDYPVRQLIEIFSSISYLRISYWFPLDNSWKLNYYVSKLCCCIIMWYITSIQQKTISYTIWNYDVKIRCE